ncbi:hypothetical protein [Halorarum halobium]|uniref:hypothetical protein n=1 Tax=Halorarum halobium TaxID=3075121 RepID=UPI0028A62134|nr:hypothetical protein [Halobaculum sp. XH14]
MSRVPTTETAGDVDLFYRMAREFPVRTCIFTFGLPLFALFQLINGVINDGSLLVIACFSAVVVAYSVLVTQYHVASYRRQRVTRTPAE